MEKRTIEVSEGTLKMLEQIGEYLRSEDARILNKSLPVTYWSPEDVINYMAGWVGHESPAIGKFVFTEEEEKKRQFQEMMECAPGGF